VVCSYNGREGDADGGLGSGTFVIVIARPWDWCPETHMQIFYLIITNLIEQCNTVQVRYSNFYNSTFNDSSH
jgi:hypothetical protein